MAKARDKEILRLLNLGHRTRHAQFPCRSYTLGPLNLQERTLIRMRDAGLIKVGHPPEGGNATYLPTLAGLAEIEEDQVGDRE